mmetsp:Transcript_2411/g.4401  ORF Transcript_2411/g.4401 Transcript_2411/m.4401 type:complete len:94 (-) Transcript_2411:33-314(-)
MRHQGVARHFIFNCIIDSIERTKIIFASWRGIKSSLQHFEKLNRSSCLNNFHAARQLTSLNLDFRRSDMVALRWNRTGWDISFLTIQLLHFSS